MRPVKLVANGIANNDYLVIIMPVKWNFASRRCVDKKDRVRHAMLLADEFMRHPNERQSLARNDIDVCGWCHGPTQRDWRCHSKASEDRGPSHLTSVLDAVGNGYGQMSSGDR